MIFDSPCLYADLLARGQQLAQEAGAAYRYIECQDDPAIAIAVLTEFAPRQE